MKNIYPIALSVVLLVVFSGCSKDFLKRYEKRITGGTWELYKVKTSGWGSNYDPVFLDGRFTFDDDGHVMYTDNAGTIYHGEWDIRRHSYYDGNNQRSVKALYMTVTSTLSQDVLAEFYDEMQFTGTDRFCAYIYDRGRQYNFYFRR